MNTSVKIKDNKVIITIALPEGITGTDAKKFVEETFKPLFESIDIQTKEAKRAAREAEKERLRVEYEVEKAKRKADRETKKAERATARAERKAAREAAKADRKLKRETMKIAEVIS